MRRQVQWNVDGVTRRSHQREECMDSINVMNLPKFLLPLFQPAPLPLTSVSNMSPPTAACKLLVLSLPFVLSLPQALPPYQFINATETATSPTGVPEPAPILDPETGNGTTPNVTTSPPLPIPIEPGIGDNIIPDIFVDPLLPFDPIPFPLPTVTTPLDPILSDPVPVEPLTPPVTPPVSLDTITPVLQPLLDIISDLLNSLLENEPLVRPLDSAADTDAPNKRRDVAGADLPLDTISLLSTLKGLISTAITILASGSVPIAGVSIDTGLSVADLVSVLEAAQTVISTVDIPPTTPVAASPGSLRIRSLHKRQWWPFHHWNPVKPVAPLNPWTGLGGWGTPKPTTTPAEPVTDTKGSTTDDGLTVPQLDTASSLELLEQLIDLSLKLVKLSVPPTPLTKRDDEDFLAFTAVPVVGDLVKLINSLISITIKLNGGPFRRALRKRDTLPEVSSNALFKFYASLARDQEPIDTLGPFTATLKESFDALDDTTQAALLRVLASEPVHLELTKRQGRVGDGFINQYIEEFHYLYPILTELAPDIADGLEDVLSDPSRPLPPAGSLDLDKLPDQLTQFVLDTYIFWEIIGDAVLDPEEKLQILLKLFDGLKIEKRMAITKREFTPRVAENNIVDLPTGDEDRVGYVVASFWALDPAMQSIGTESDAQLYAPWNDAYSNVDVDLDSLVSNFGNADKEAVWKYIEFVELLHGLSKEEQARVQEILQSSPESSSKRKRGMHRGLMTRQGDFEIDDGAALDDAPSKYSYMNYV